MTSIRIDHENTMVFHKSVLKKHEFFVREVLAKDGRKSFIKFKNKRPDLPDRLFLNF
jgi:hypothetical protein